MNTIFAAGMRYLETQVHYLLAGWHAFWFTPTDPLTLGVMRIAVGACLLYLYGGCLPVTLSYIGPNAWVDAQAVRELAALEGASIVNNWSLWVWLESTFKASLLHYYFLAAIVCFMVGLFSRTANVAVWVLHLSYIHRSLVTWYGVDVILSMLLFYMLWAPTGATASLDHLWRRKSFGGAVNSIPKSWTANAAVRAIQLHMCVIYLCSGLAKLQGESWWDGSAIWQVLMIHELGPINLEFLAALDDRFLQMLSTAGVALTIAFEVSFPYLIWNPRWKPLILAAAVVLHGLIGALMGLGAFSSVMLTGCLAFVSPQTLRWMGKQLRTAN